MLSPWEFRRKQMVIPGGCDVSGERMRTSLVRAEIGEGDGRDEDDAVEVNLVAVLQDLRHLRRPRGPVAFA